MPLLYSEVQKQVQRALTKKVFKSMLEFVEKAQPKMWGLERPKFFTKRMLVLAMYHALTGKGYTKIMEKVEGLGFKVAVKTLKFNTQSIRRVLAEWGKNEVTMGEKKDWKKSMKKVVGTKQFPDLHFWIDSTDFAMTNKGGKRKKDPDWSYKCNSKGRRYMVLTDGRGRIKKMWGGYSPKVYDGHFLQLTRKWFEKRLKGSGVIADQHFEWGKNLKGLKWYTANHTPSRGRKTQATPLSIKLDTDDEGVDLSLLTKKQQSYNQALYTLRARVELPFGVAKTIFKILRGHWRESEQQLDHMVWIATGVVNAKI